jgi:hypothetical protein
MILLDPVPTLLLARGAPVVFCSPEETVEYPRVHGVQRWIVCGSEDGWWPIYTLAGPLRVPPPLSDESTSPCVVTSRASSISTRAHRRECFGRVRRGPSPGV